MEELDYCVHNVLVDQTDEPELTPLRLSKWFTKWTEISHGSRSVSRTLKS